MLRNLTALECLNVFNDGQYIEKRDNVNNGLITQPAISYLKL
jgi:hypothetical protein